MLFQVQYFKPCWDLEGFRIEKSDNRKVTLKLFASNHLLLIAIKKYYSEITTQTKSGMMIAIEYRAHQQNNKKSKTSSLSSPLSQAAPPFLMSGSIFLTMPSWTSFHDGMRLFIRRIFYLLRFLCKSNPGTH